MNMKGMTCTTTSGNLLGQGLFYLNFIDAIAEGDGNRIIRCCKFLMLHFYAEKKYKYAIEAQYLLLQQYSLLLLRQAIVNRNKDMVRKAESRDWICYCSDLCPVTSRRRCTMNAFML